MHPQVTPDAAPAPSQDSRKSVKVTIYNQSYTLMVSGEPGEVEALANSVDDLMTGIAQKAGNVDSTRVAVMASLHLADKVRSMERELTDLRACVDEKAREFSLLLDQAIR